MPQSYQGLQTEYQPDYQAFIANLKPGASDSNTSGSGGRVFFTELYHDAEIVDAIADRFQLMADMDESHPDYHRWKLIRVNRFVGLDYITTELLDQQMPFHTKTVEDFSADIKRKGGRQFVDDHSGPVANWDDFEKLDWPDPTAPAATRDLEWYQQNLPDDMCIVIGGHWSHIMQWLQSLMGYEPLCYALYEQRDLVGAMADKLADYFAKSLEIMLQYDRAKIVWARDDMGFKSGLLLSPDDIRQFVLSGHKRLAKIAHDAGCPYLLHSCGNLASIMDDLIDDVQIDGKHSFEDTIETVSAVKQTYGRKIALLGGMPVDFLCRATEQEIRQRTRETLDTCLPGGGFAIGSGNSVTNYMPLDNYLAMIDEARLY